MVETPALTSDKKKKKKSSSPSSLKKRERKSDRKEKKRRSSNGGDERHHDESSSSKGGVVTFEEQSDNKMARREETEEGIVTRTNQEDVVSVVEPIHNDGDGDDEVQIVESVSQRDGTASSSSSSSSTNKIRLVVHRPNPHVDPIVVSFPSGVPTSILSAERKQQQQLRRRDGGNDDDDNHDGSNHESAPASTSNLPYFTWRKERTDQQISSSSSSSRGHKSRVTVVSGQDSTCSYEARTATASIKSSSSTTTTTSSGNNGIKTDYKNKRLTSLYVGVYDKQTQTVTIHPSAKNGTIFSLSQRVVVTNSGNNNNDNESNERNNYMDTTMSNLTPQERKHILFESFGSSKKRRVLKSQAANVVSVDSVVGAGSAMISAVSSQGNAISESNRMAMEETTKGGKMDAVAQAYDEARRKFLPPFNAQADLPHKVYDAMQIAGDDVWGQASRVFDAITRREDEGEGAGGESDNWRKALTDRGRWYDSIISLLNGINISKQSGRGQVQTAIVLNYLMRFHSRCHHKPFMGGTVEEIANFMYLPVEVCGRFLELFATAMPEMNHDGRSGFAMTRQHRDRRLVHALILYVLAHGPEMKVGSINDVAKDLQLEVNDAGRLLQQAGFTVRKNSTSGIMSVTLHVPLQFPEPKKRVSRR